MKVTPDLDVYATLDEYARETRANSRMTIGEFCDQLIAAGDNGGHLYYQIIERELLARGYKFDGKLLRAGKIEHGPQCGCSSYICAACLGLESSPAPEAPPVFTPERPTKPSIRQRVDYDSEAFGEDLELAINHVRSVALGEHRREFSQPSLMGSVPMERAMYLVCLSLIERKLGADFDRYLDQVLDDARVLLISKNKSYGNSALDPVRVFSKASLKEQLLVRLDDKVSRLARGQAAGEDVAADLLGYLLLVIIADKRERD